MYQKKQTVKWKWGNGEGVGTVSKIFTSTVSKTIKGTTVKRNASDAEPAYLITQSDGDEVLKSHTELSDNS